MIESREPRSRTCAHEIRGGYGSCGKTYMAIEYSVYEDGCWMARIRHPNASVLRGHGSRQNIWWLADAENKPHWCFTSYDFTMALKIKEMATKLLTEVPTPVAMPTTAELLQALVNADKRIQYLESVLSTKRRRKRGKA